MIILRVYRHGKLVAVANEQGEIRVLEDGLGKPYVEYPYVSAMCIPDLADTNQAPRKWGHPLEET